MSTQPKNQKLLEGGTHIDGHTWVNVNFNSSILPLSKNVNSEFNQSWIYELLLKNKLGWDFRNQ
jgi:hypothetical protein